MSRRIAVWPLAFAVFIGAQAPAKAGSPVDAGNDCATFSDVDFKGKFSEELGERLYHRGFYPEAMTVWHCAFLEEEDAGSAYRMGIEYIDAKVVEFDSGRAVEILTASALRGEPRAQFELAVIYEDGEIAAADAASAMRWYLAAAGQGHAAAEYSLGLIHEKGVAAEKDIVLAYAYYELASSHGWELANESKDRLAVEMSERDIELALQTGKKMEEARATRPAIR